MLHQGTGALLTPAAGMYKEDDGRFFDIEQQCYRHKCDVPQIADPNGKGMAKMQASFCMEKPAGKLKCTLN